MPSLRELFVFGYFIIFPIFLVKCYEIYILEIELFGQAMFCRIHSLTFHKYHISIQLHIKYDSLYREHIIKLSIIMSGMIAKFMECLIETQTT